MVYDALKARKRWLDREIGRLTKRLSNVPEGRLVLSVERGNLRYYQSLNTRKSRKYLSKCEQELCGQLAQKSYDETVLPILKKELKGIEWLLALNAPALLDEAYVELRDGRKSLISPLLLPDDEYRELWELRAYDSNPMPIERGFETRKGDVVRSKSEVIIADALYAADVPYLYECPLVLNNGRTVYPDFRVLNLRTRKEYYWEHFGMMGEPGYADNMIEKMNDYELSDYFPGKGLIVTLECANVPLNTTAVRGTIEAFLL